jgi:hypothetical protein
MLKNTLAPLIPGGGAARSRWNVGAAAALMSVLCAFALMLNSPGSSPRKEERLGLLDGNSLWTQLVHSASAREHTEVGSLAQEIQKAEQSVGLSSQSASRRRQTRRRPGLPTPLSSSSVAAQQVKQLILKLEVAQAANGEKRAISKERKAEKELADIKRHTDSVQQTITSFSPSAAPSPSDSELEDDDAADDDEPGSGASDDADLLTDQQLRADIARLQRDFKPTMGAVARAKKAAAAQQKKPAAVEKRKSSTALAALNSIQKELKTLPNMFALQILKMSGQVEGLPDSSAHEDKKHCLPPNVWANGSCKV